MTLPARPLPLSLVVAGLTLCAPARAQDDDDRIIIIDDGPIPETPKPGTDDDIIVIPYDDDETEPAPPASSPISGALGRLWETWHVEADSSLLGTVQLVPPEDGPWRLLGSVWLESRLLPAPNLSFYANGFARAAVDGTPTGKLTPFADFYEAYAKVTVDRAVVTLGRLVVPWGRTQGAALGDRLNPPDHRRGPPFPDAGRLRQPLWGANARTSVGSLGVEAVAFGLYEPTEGSLAASNQGGPRLARYQTALVRSPARAGGLLAADDTAAIQEDHELLASGTVGGRVWRRVGDVDISGSAVWGFDETPTLQLRPDVARALAGELLSLRPGFVDDAPQSCNGDVSLACLGGKGTLTHARTTSFSVDASWGLGVVIARAELAAYPNIGGTFGGKSAIVVDDLGLRTVQLSQYAAVVAFEGSLGESIDGSLEIFDVVWQGVPAGTLLWGVEPFQPAPEEDERTVHRVAAGASVGGAFLEDRVRWRVRGEAGILQPDVLVSAELRYRLPILGLYVGGRSDLFTGVAGSPGWFRQDGSLVGVFVGEGS